MTPTLSVAIMHAPWAQERASWVRALVSECSPRARRLQVVEDHTRAGCWPTAKRAWRAASGTHHLVVQDDVELCRGFMSHALAAIEANPSAPIGFFMCAKKGATLARDRGLSWVQVRGHITAQALCLPSTMVDDWLRWDRANVNDDFKHDDWRMNWWLAATETPMWFTVPCLAEHVGDKTSLLGHHPPTPRLAPWYEREPGPIDWSRGLGEDALRVVLHSDKKVLSDLPKHRRTP